MQNAQTVFWEDIDFVVRYCLVDGDELKVEFEAYRVNGLDVSEHPTPEEIARLELFLKGNVLGSGCANMTGNPSKMWHFCNEFEIAEAGILMERLGQLAADDYDPGSGVVKDKATIYLAKNQADALMKSMGLHVKGPWWYLASDAALYAVKATSERQARDMVVESGSNEPILFAYEAR